MVFNLASFKPRVPQQDNAAPCAVVHLSAPGDRLMELELEPVGGFSLKNGAVSAGKSWENPIKNGTTWENLRKKLGKTCKIP